MKKYYVVFPLLFLIAALGSTENVEVQKEAQDTPPDNKIAAFDGSLLIHKPKSFWLLQYQNPQGKTFSNKEVKAMLMEIPENKTVLKSYNIWKGSAYTLLGVCLGALTVNTVYAISDYSFPHAQEVDTIASITIILSGLYAINASFIANIRYLEAVDNYNLHILKDSTVQ